MKLLPIIYLGYMFIAIYFLVFYILVYLINRKDIFKAPSANKKYSVSVLVPAFNEENTIQDTIDAIFNIDYPIEELFA